MRITKKAFTLIELIIVIAIIAILAAAIFVAVDPARRLHEARNAVRSSDIATILEAVKKNQVDNDGDLLAEIDSLTAANYYVIGSCSSGATCTAVSNEPGCVDISGLGDNYLAEVPEDPKDSTASETKYYLLKSTDGAITVGSCEPEGEGAGGTGTPPDLEVTR